MNGISRSSILRGLARIKKTSFNLFTFRPSVPGAQVKNTNAIRGAVLRLPFDHFLNTLSIDVQDPQNKTFVASASHTNRKLSDQSTSGPRDMPFWPCRPHDSFQLQRVHSQANVSPMTRVLRCVTKSIPPA